MFPAPPASPGLTFNSVTCIVLLLAVGISVDYSAHIMRAFLTAVGTRQQRAHKALAEIGGAVWNGAFTTFLAILPMVSRGPPPPHARSIAVYSNVPQCTATRTCGSCLSLLGVCGRGVHSSCRVE